VNTELIESLNRAGKATAQLELPNGSELLLLPYGGRILGLFPKKEAENFYWTNPALETAATARNFIGSRRWQNIGGERTWLGPEIEFFFPRFPDASVYQPPRPFDGLDYFLERGEGWARLSLDFTVEAHRARSTVSVRISKTVSSTADPLLRQDGTHRFAGLRYAGYALNNTLERTAAARPEPAVGLWSISQLPHGGEAIIPVSTADDPRVFFGSVPPEDLRIEGSHIRYHMRSNGEHKIGIKAGNSKGLIGYSVENGEEADLFVRRFAVDPSGLYVDGPPRDPADSGYASEACNVANPDLGRFGEIEYHAPALDRNRMKCEDVSEVWAYRGPRPLIAAAAKALLGAAPNW
jgi:hypothetical protein